MEFLMLSGTNFLSFFLFKSFGTQY
jgi:hypothetical protein